MHKYMYIYKYIYIYIELSYNLFEVCVCVFTEEYRRGVRQGKSNGVQTGPPPRIAPTRSQQGTSARKRRAMSHVAPRRGRSDDSNGYAICQPEWRAGSGWHMSIDAVQ